MNQITIIDPRDVDREGFKHRLQDCSRVGTPFVSSGGNNFDAWRSGEGRKDRPLKHGSPSQKIQEGRFPANLILMHSPECVYTGKKKVKGHHHCVLGNKNSSRDGISYSIGKPYSGVTGYTQKDGTEIVDNWECSNSCPVGLLDAQSGNRPSTLSHKGIEGGAKYQHPAKNETLRKLVKTRVAYNYDFGGGSHVYADNGGASRFFKQVTSQEELDRYFHDLLDKMP